MPSTGPRREELGDAGEGQAYLADVDPREVAVQVVDGQQLQWQLQQACGGRTRETLNDTHTARVSGTEHVK